MTTTNPVTFVKVQDAQPSGKYQATSVDRAKAAADMILVQVNPKIVRSQIGAIKGRGVKFFGQDLYQVTDSAWSKLQTQYTCKTDF